MTESQVPLSSEEFRYLAELLESVLKDARVEEHRTRAPSYRQHVLRQERLIQGLLDKLRQPVA